MDYDFIRKEVTISPFDEEGGKEVLSPFLRPLLRASYSQRFLSHTQPEPASPQRQKRPHRAAGALFFIFLNIPKSRLAVENLTRLSFPQGAVLHLHLESW